MSKIGAFFDIDGTIFRGSLLNNNFHKLRRHEVIDDSVWHDQVKDAYNKWKKRRGDYDSYLKLLAKVYLENLIGIDKKYLEFLANQTIEDSFDSVYRYSRSRLKWHLNEGHEIFFISGSPDFLVKEMAKKYDVTDFRGSEYIADKDGKLTGEVRKMWNSESKHTVVLEFAEEYDIDLEKSFAYGDTNGDFSMLKLVGNPIAINPNMDLIRLLKEDDSLCEKAKIIVERKDSIYSLSPNVEIYKLEYEV